MALAGAFAPAAPCASPTNDRPAASAMAGAVVRFEESRGANVVYLEEKAALGPPAPATVSPPREPPREPPRARKGEKAAKR